MDRFLIDEDVYREALRTEYVLGRREGFVLGFIVTLVLSLALMVTSTATGAADYRDQRLPAFSAVASKLAGKRVVVVSHNFGPGSPAGEARLYEDGSAWIGLAPSYARTLLVRGKVIAPEYPRPSTGEAILTLAHEIGHVQGRPDPGQWEEARADCYAASHWRLVAARLGYTPGQIKALDRQLVVPGVGHLAECWGPYK